MFIFALVSIALLLAHVVHAGVYVTGPIQASQCTAGQTCQVQWTDDGTAPLLSAIGECQVGLYVGQYQLVQSLSSVDVATTNSFSFTPDPSIASSGPFYLVFTASSINYRSFSGSFAITGLSGTTPSGSSTPATTPSDTASTPSDTTTAASVTPTLTTPTVTTTTPTPTATSRTTTTTSASRTSTSTSASATPSNAAGRVGSPTTLVGLAALFVGVFAF